MQTGRKVLNLISASKPHILLPSVYTHERVGQKTISIDLKKSLCLLNTQISLYFISFSLLLLKSARRCLANILAPTLLIKNLSTRATILLYSKWSLLILIFVLYILVKCSSGCHNLTDHRNAFRVTTVIIIQAIKI